MYKNSKQCYTILRISKTTISDVECDQMEKCYNFTFMINLLYLTNGDKREVLLGDL